MKVKNLKGLKSLETLKMEKCPELDEFPIRAEVTFLKVFELMKCHKLQKIGGLENLRSLKILNIEDCPALNTLPFLAELTSLEEFKLKKCHKLEKIEGLGLTSLEKLEHSEKSLVVVANNTPVFEPSITDIQKRPREVIVCTRAVIDVESLEDFFTSFPLDIVVEFGPSGDLALSMPDSAANAILICFVIEKDNPNLLFQICTGKDHHFCTEMSNVKWVWMGIFPQESNWLQSKRYEIWACREDEEEEVEVEEAWFVMGKEESIVEAFHQLSERNSIYLLDIPVPAINLLCLIRGLFSNIEIT